MREIDEDDASTLYDSRPYLDPRDVIALASTVPNCSQVMPPSGRHLSSKRPVTSLQSQFSSDSTSYFSQISCHLTETFSIDKNDDEYDARTGRGDDQVLSFLVSDSYSIEQLAAEAEGRSHRTNPLDGLGIARIDVYCQTGTVCTCRLIQTAAAATSSDAPYHNHLETPRKGNVTTAMKTSNKSYQESTQFRRIVRQKCNLDALRSILTQPPKLPEINSSVIDNTSPEDDDDNNSQCSTVSTKLRLRRKNRLADKFAFLSAEQQKFLKEQKKMYEKRMKQDEKIRRNMANAILSGGINESDPEMTIPSLESLSLQDAVSSAPTMETAETCETTIIHPYYTTRQQLIQDKLEIADVGLAILMAEAQRLKKIMKEMEKAENESQNNTDEEDSYTNLGTDTERSRSTYRSTDHEDGDTTIISHDSDAVQTMQGCEVEYSFPHKYHDFLEGALMGENNDDEESSCSEDEVDSRGASTTFSTAKNTKGTRGRSPPRGGHNNGKSTAATTPKLKEILSPIVAIPTNGQGCIVLRQDGSFDVVGKIPDVLRRKLFRRNGPLPDYVSLGTKGRYYVHFDDDSFYFYGPPPLTRILKKVNRQQRRRNDKYKRGKRSNGAVSVVSVSFGKKLDDIFVVLSNGAWEAHGDIPSGLEELMKNRNDRADLLWASIGVNGEWCVKSNKGNLWWGNVTNEADEALSEVLAQDVMFIDFGMDGSYFLLYK